MTCPGGGSAAVHAAIGAPSNKVRPCQVRARPREDRVAFGLRDSLDLMTDMGVRPGRARVSGGGARSGLWLEIIASVLDVPLERMAVDEGAAYGAALLGAVAAGVFASVEEAVEACVRVTAVVDPDPALVKAYAGLLPHYRALYPALRAVRR